ncbi:MAG: hypothetical protein AAGH41_13960 [Pseudomonadota bacterium]
MGSVAIVLARALIMAPFLVSAANAGLDYTSASMAFAKAYPQLEALFPVLLGAQVVIGLIIILGLPLHRALAAVAAVVVVLLAAYRAPFWNVIGREEVMLMNIFVGAMAQAGGLLLITAMPRRGQ